MTDCKKKVFESKSEAKRRACEINKENYGKKGVRKMRAYLCNYCGKYHLTSLHIVGYQFRTNIKVRNRLRESAFIKRESEYWEQRFKM